MISQEIEDKYEIISILQKTAATAVLLVRHKQIGEIRILKAIQKASPNSKAILSEANLLSEIKSPKLPTIYDVGETTDANYLIEEYVEGQPLQEYLISNKPVNLNTLISILLDVCEIVHLLHISAEEPYIYRDMKPEHIIVNERRVVLIDFGAAVKKSRAGEEMSYCSKSFASPEQLNCQEIDERADIYGIGKVIEYSLDYVEALKGYKLKQIVKLATEPEPSKRIMSVTELMAMLKALQGSIDNEQSKIKCLNKDIAVVGSDTGVGCTHFSINMCQYLNSMKNEFFYKSCDDKATVQRLYRNLNSYELKEGVLYHNCFRGIMDYGPSIKAQIPPGGNRIFDYGCVCEKPLSDIVIYILGLKPWGFTDNMPSWLGDENVIIVSNFGSKIETLRYSKRLNKAIFMYCKNSRPFKISNKEKRLFQILQKEMMD